MTRLARVFQRIDPVVLVLHHRLDPIPVRARAGELILGGNSHHRIPIDTWIVFGSRGCCRRTNGVQIQVLPGCRPHLRRVDQAVSANPNVIRRPWQLRNNVAAEIIGDDHFGELGRKVGRFRYHPYTRLWPAWTRDHTTNICGADSDVWPATLLSTE